MKSYLLSIVVVMLLLFAGCTTDFSFERNDFEKNQSEPTQSSSGGSSSGGNFLSVEDYFTNATQYSTSYCNASSKIRCSVEQSYYNEETGEFSLVFTYLGVRGEAVTEVTSNSCDFQSIRNVDTQVNGTELTFLNGQTGVVVFNNCESGEINGNIMLKDSQTEIVISKSFEYSSGGNPIESFSPNWDVFPKNIGNYTYESFDAVMDSQYFEIYMLVYSNDDGEDAIFALFKGDVGEIYSELISSNSFVANVEGNTFITAEEGVSYVAENSVFDVVYVDLRLFDMLEFTLDEFEIKNEETLRIAQESNLDILSDEELIKKEFLETWFVNYQRNLNKQIEQQSNVGSAISVERLENGVIYIKNRGNEVEENFRVEISNSHGSSNDSCSVEGESIEPSSVAAIYFNCTIDLITDEVYNVVIITESEVFSEDEIVR